MSELRNDLNKISKLDTVYCLIILILLKWYILTAAKAFLNSFGSYIMHDKLSDYVKIIYSQKISFKFCFIIVQFLFACVIM
jgi:hypothetical protein